MMIKRPNFVLAIALSTMFACSGNDTDPSDPQAFFNFTANGRSQTASGTSMDGDATNRSLTGPICNPFGGVNIQLREPLAIGAVPANQLLAASYFEPNAQWDFLGPSYGPSQKGSGTVTLSAVTPRIIGTFQFTMVQLYPTAGGQITVQGSFNMDYAPRKVCPG